MFDNPDFVKCAEVYGARATRVSAIADFREALETDFAGGGVHPVVVPIDCNENMRVLVEELRQRLPVR